MDKDLLDYPINNEEAFDRLWAAKPSRKGDNSKIEARKSFFRLIDQGVDVNQILAAVEEWAEQSRNTPDRRNIPMVATWLNQRRFEGENYSQPRSRTNTDQIAAFMMERGWHWEGSRWVKRRQEGDDTRNERRSAQPPLSLEQKANLFVSMDLPWFPALADRHHQDGGSQSYFGKGPDKDSGDGIWVPKWWYEQMRYASREKVSFGDINPVKARPLDDTPPEATEKTEEIQQASPPPKKTKSWSEEADQDFGG